MFDSKEVEGPKTPTNDVTTRTMVTGDATAHDGYGTCHRGLVAISDLSEAEHSAVTSKKFEGSLCYCETFVKRYLLVVIPFYDLLKSLCSVPLRMWPNILCVCESHSPL